MDSKQPKNNSFQGLQRMIRKFCDDRNWSQFHNLKDLAISLNLEAAEVLEVFQWLSSEELDKVAVSKKSHLAEELSDVLYWVLLLANKLDINLENAFVEKMSQNEKKYPVNKSKGNHKKYTELD